MVSAEQQRGGLVVTPALIDVAISSAHPDASARIVVQNNFSSDVELVATLGGLQQQGGRLVPSGDIDPLFGGIISFQPNIITVGPGATADIMVYFQNSEQLSPGGHYGAITIRQTNANQSQIGLQAAVSVGMFVTKLDGAVQRVDATQVKTNGSIFRLPTTVDTSFRNSGNVLVVPRAAITTVGLKSIVANGVANTESIGILPNETTVIRTNLTRKKIVALPGIYTTNVLYRADGSAEQHTVTISQYYVPPLLIVLLLAGLAILVAVHFGKKRKQKKNRAEAILLAGTMSSASTKPVVTKKVVNDVVVNKKRT